MTTTATQKQLLTRLLLELALYPQRAREVALERRVSELTAALAAEQAAHAERQRDVEHLAESVRDLSIALGDVVDWLRDLAARWWAWPVRAAILEIARRAEAVIERVGTEGP